MKLHKPFVAIPAYNEEENIKELVKDLLKLKIKNLNVIVIDDRSTDSTFKVVSEISKKNKNVHIQTKKGVKGRGQGVIEGFQYAMKHGADVLCEMDGDLSHDPKYLPIMLKELNNADVILGSRFVKGGSDDTKRSFLRKFSTVLANIYIRIMWGIDVKDSNSGYRCFKRKVIDKIDLSKLLTTGHSTIQEMLYRAYLSGFKIKEVPIHFYERKYGESKIGFKDFMKVFATIFRLKVLHIFGKI